MRSRRPDAASERRLDQLRREAEERGSVAAEGVRPVASPLPRADAEHGYYDLPLLKPPVWTWEVPVYFFVGGAAGAAACIALAGRVAGGDGRLVRRAQWVAAAGAVLSAPLLIADLGRPERFLNMLRVFKPQSPMSVGAWILAAFGASSAAAVATGGLARDAAAGVAAVTGLGMATYTGVLLGATAVPLWAQHASILPIHFGSSALGSAVSVLELTGAREGALQRLGIIAAAAETALVTAVEAKGDEISRPIRRGRTGLTTTVAGALSGPLPLLLRVLYPRSGRARRAAAVSALVGSLLTRFAWIEAGRASAGQPLSALRRGDAPRPRQPVGKRQPVGESGHGEAGSPGEQGEKHGHPAH